jgi:hypothetical protein
VVMVSSKSRKAENKNKKVDDFKTKKDSILAMLDLNSNRSETQKVAKQLITQRKQAKQAQAKKHKVVTWKQVLEEKEKHIVPLNLNIDLRRLTQLFGRSLYIKYFIKNIDQNLIRRKSQSS